MMRFFQAEMLEEELYISFIICTFQKRNHFFCKRGGSIIIFIAVSSGIFVWNILYNNTIYQRRLCLHFAFLCHSFIVFRLIQNFCLNRITSSSGVGPRYKKRIVSTVLDKRAFKIMLTFFGL